jgi:crossover junction endodeoxyribonuclease RusA
VGAVLILTIPAPCEPINANHRLHPHVKAKRTAAWRARAQVAAIQAGKPRMERAHIRATVGYPDARSYDAGNFYPTAKACVDGIVRDAGCLPDDSNTYVVGPDMREGDKIKPFTLTITLDPDCDCVDCVTRWAA